MKKYSIALISVIILLSCTKAPVMKVYSLKKPSLHDVVKPIYKKSVLKVSFPYSISEEVSDRMNFSYSNTDYGTYLHSKWSNHVGKLLQGIMIETLAKSQLFKAVLPSTSTLQSDYRLESNIFMIEHKVRGQQSYAVLSIQFTFINTDTGKLVKSKLFYYKEATKSIDAKGYADATNSIIEHLVVDLLHWLQ